MSERLLDGLEAGSLDRLMQVLVRAQAIGLVGKGDPRGMVEHAMGFADGAAPPLRLLDLGSGGGLPGLVLAERWPETEVVLLDGRRKSVDFLTQAMSDLVLGERVRVLEGRAEVLARDSELRGEFDMVAARGFAPPAVTAECGSPFLQASGRLVVSEPPMRVGGKADDRDEGDERWPVRGLAVLGLVEERRWSGKGHYVALRQEGECPGRFPRRVGVPGKRPLF